MGLMGGGLWPLKFTSLGLYTLTHRLAAVFSRTPFQDFHQKYIPGLVSCLNLSDKALRKSRAHRPPSSVFLLLFSVL